MSDLFVLASRKQFRFPSERGDLTVEQLWNLPLIGKFGNSGFDLDTVARTLNSIVKELGEESFVETKINPKRDEYIAKLEVVKFIIATNQEETKAAELKASRADERRKIMDAIANAEQRELSSASKEDLLKRLAALSE